MAQLVTKLENLINPEVIGAFLQKKMVDNMVLAPLARIGYDLVNTPGDTLQIPQYQYIGDAIDVAEGEQISTVQLKSTMVPVTVKKIVQGVELTDEAILSAHTNPINETVRQLALSIASKVDNDLFAAVRALTPATDVKIDDGYEWVLDAQAAFGEDLNEETFLVISPRERANILRAPGFVHIDNGNKVLNGQLGTLWGVNVIISNKVKSTTALKEAILLRREGLALELKRNMEVEPIRKGEFRTSILSADQHYIAYVRDATRVVYIKTTTP